MTGTKQSDEQGAPAGVTAGDDAGSAGAPEPLEEAARIDETRAGGRFLVNGRLVDADGAPIEE